MPLTPDKFVIANGPPASGNQPTKSSAYGDAEIGALDSQVTQNTGDIAVNKTDITALQTGKLSTVTSDATLTGDGTAGTPLAVATPYTTAEQTKLAGIEDGAQVNTVTSVAGKTGAVALVLGDSTFERNDQTGTAYSLVDADHGKMVTLDNAAAITLSVPSGLRSDFYCSILQKGAGKVTILGSGSTVNNRQGFSDLAGQWSVVSIVSVGVELYVTQGDMA